MFQEMAFLNAFIAAQHLSSPTALPKDKPFTIDGARFRGFVHRVQAIGVRSLLDMNWPQSPPRSW